jgi:hypothetical protein
MSSLDDAETNSYQTNAHRPWEFTGDGEFWLD